MSRFSHHPLGVYPDREHETLTTQAFSIDPSGTHKNHWGNVGAAGRQEEEVRRGMSKNRWSRTVSMETGGNCNRAMEGVDVF